MKSKRVKKNKNMWKDVRAVSPVVAVLILIIVAVIGGVAIGMIETGIIKRGETEAEFGEMGVMTLKVIGGPGVAPLMQGIEGVEVAGGETIIKAFEEKYPKVKIDFLRECCGFAMYALPKGVCDLGIGRRFPTAAEVDAYPDLKTTIVGKAPLAVIVNNESTLFRAPFHADNKTLKEMFIDTPAAQMTVVYPTEATELVAPWMAKGVEAGMKPVGEVYGTSIQGMFSLYLMKGPSATDWILGGSEDNLVLNENINDNEADYTLVNTQEDVIAAVAANTDAIGFVNYVVACDAIDEGEPIVILGLDEETKSVGPEANEGDVDLTDTELARKEIGRNDAYVTGLGGPMLTPVIFFHQGEPDPIEQELINFCLAFEGVEIQNAHGFLAGEDIEVAATCPFHTE
jgi:ABC-type phosphate transport system substrate-binding protein